MILPIHAESQELDLHRRDTLRLLTTKSQGAEFRVSVEVHNDQELAGIDVPLRFADQAEPVTLVDVEWSDRVKNWDFKHAAIDNVNKTVILGMIAEVGGTHPDPYLRPHTVGDPTVATLVFKVEGDHRPELSTFTTEAPHHSLTFLYNHLEDSVLTVKEFKPALELIATDE